MEYSRRFLIRLAATAVCLLAAMTVYEVAKQLLFPDIGIWESHIVTILFTAILGTTLSFFVFRRIDRLNADLEQRVATRTAELRQALAELESFSYSVSHDLRAPLRAMASFAALLEKHPGVSADAELHDYAQRVARNSVRMGRLVDELLHYVRLGRQPIDLQRVSLGELASTIVTDLTEQHPGRRIHWEIGPLPEVRADPTLLRLVLQNLMENAVKYTRSRNEAQIELGAHETGSEVRVAVRDNGVGFDMAHAGKLFAPFERLHDGSDYEGTGIGLAHARRIVERHGGRIWCKAAPEAGATFEFSLPR